MIPKTLIRYSKIYNKVFDSNFPKKDFFKFKKDCIKFEKIYEQHIKQILQLIEKHHSKNWKYKFIPIYIVNKMAPFSFSDPLTLKFREDEKYLLIVLVHELLHNNIKKKFKDSTELHIYMEPILNKIILDIPIGLKKELDLFNKNMRQNYKIK